MCGAAFLAETYVLFYSIPSRHRPACNVEVQSADFLGQLVAEGRTVVVRRDEERVVAAATMLLHRAAHVRYAELQLLAVSGGQARRGLGSGLLTAVEGWLRGRGMRSCVVLAGLDTVGFWRKRGYEDEVELSPQQWGVLRDPFGNSKVMIKVL